MKRIVWLLSLLAAISLSCTNTPGIEEGYLEVNGTSLFYKTMGSGEPLVALHGGPGFDHRQFLPYIWELSRRYKVILFDQRGTGLSSGPIDSTSISVDSFIADIEGIREAFGIDKMNLLGHSWGGILAMHYGIRHPEKLNCLILCSTAASHESFDEMRTNYEVNRTPEDQVRLEEIYVSEAFQDGDPQAVEAFWQIFFKPYFADQELASKLDLQFTENSIKHGNEVASLILQSIGEFDLHEDLKAVRCPTPSGTRATELSTGCVFPELQRNRLGASCSGTPFPVPCAIGSPPTAATATTRAFPARSTRSPASTA